ncbi:DEAD/DEAH box helicase [Faecalibacter sp. LW9]|uniref:DEAD/DEAH box helicase n=1 Tax=Faecalibacter sp. LW9 TaxID=3103144 RepID=UPI002AFE6EF9|nr:DEAD/DEAH box helicase [Faecalibacter sp. LW9]
MTFNQLDIIQPILKAIETAGYTQPTEIQERSIPTILKGNDIIGCAQTGTGKTAAFAIPIIQLMQQTPKKRKAIRTLVLTPTRELAVQINENFNLYKGSLRLSNIAIYGGVRQRGQVTALNRGVDILIATPGRLMDLIEQGYVHLNEVEILVLDEADRMLDMGFVNDIKKILKYIPKHRQTLFFSATMPQKIKSFAETILKQPQQIIVSPISSTTESVTQSVYMVENKKKEELLIEILRGQKLKRSLVFTRTKHGADKLMKTLNNLGVKTAAIHGNKSQNARQNALDDFKNNRITVLIATDIASRGIDIDELSFVVNYEMPNVPETYVHRIGRTGRGGNFGEAVSFCSKDERSELRDIQKLIGFKLPINPNTSCAFHLS